MTKVIITSQVLSYLEYMKASPHWGRHIVKMYGSEGESTWDKKKLQDAFEKELQSRIEEAVRQGTGWKLNNCISAHNKNLIAMSKCGEVHVWGYDMQFFSHSYNQVLIEEQICIEAPRQTRQGFAPVPHARLFIYTVHPIKVQ